MRCQHLALALSLDYNIVYVSTDLTEIEPMQITLVSELSFPGLGTGNQTNVISEVQFRTK